MRKNVVLVARRRVLLVPVVAIALLAAGCSASNPEASLRVDEQAEVAALDEANGAEAALEESCQDRSKTGITGTRSTAFIAATGLAAAARNTCQRFDRTATTPVSIPMATA